MYMNANPLCGDRKPGPILVVPTPRPIGTMQTTFIGNACAGACGFSGRHKRSAQSRA